jgi:Cofilin/tropomyosin-type actin-binding protein
MYCRPLPKVSSVVCDDSCFCDDIPHTLANPICDRRLQAWAEIRDNGNTNVDWLIAGYDNGSKTDITVLQKGSGGVEACAAALPDDEPVFGGFRLSNGRFRHFYYAPDAASVMKKGRASMHKNGVLNVMEGCDGEVNMRPGLTEADI